MMVLDRATWRGHWHIEFMEVDAHNYAENRIVVPVLTSPTFFPLHLVLTHQLEWFERLQHDLQLLCKAWLTSDDDQCH